MTITLKNNEIMIERNLKLMYIITYQNMFKNIQNNIYVYFAKYFLIIQIGPFSLKFNIDVQYEMLKKNCIKSVKSIKFTPCIVNENVILKTIV